MIAQGIEAEAGEAHGGDKGCGDRRCENRRCVAIRKSELICFEGDSRNSNFGMLRLEIWRYGHMESGRQGSSVTGNVNSEDKKKNGVVGVAVRFWDGLCFE
jgi:hypothetical protein